MAKQKIKTNSKDKLRNSVLISLFSALICVLSFITIPAPIPFTLQTFGIFTALTVLGGKRGTVSVLIYLFLGVVGLPVFSSFSGGIWHLLGPTGGYLLGFIPLALIFLIFEKICSNNIVLTAIGLCVGLISCYLTGTLWYCETYLKETNLSSFVSALGICVIPFIIPDLTKLLLSILLSNKIKNLIK